jgi:hypothetical protein
VYVDEAGRGDQPLRVDLTPARAVDPSDRGNAAVLDRDVTAETRPTGSVNDARVADD